MERRLRPSALDAARRAGVRQAQQQVQRLSAPSGSTVIGILLNIESEPAWRAEVDVLGNTLWLGATPGGYVRGGSVYVLTDSQARPYWVSGPTGSPVPDVYEPTTVGQGATPVVFQPDLTIDPHVREQLDQAVTRLESAFTTEDRPPTPEDGQGKPEGAYWTQVDGEGAQVARWRWTGTEWADAPLGVEFIPEAYIDFLAANTAFISHLESELIRSDVFIGKEFFGGTFTGTVLNINTPGGAPVFHASPAGGVMVGGEAAIWQQPAPVTAGGSSAVSGTLAPAVAVSPTGTYRMQVEVQRVDGGTGVEYAVEADWRAADGSHVWTSMPVDWHYASNDGESFDVMLEPVEGAATVQLVWVRTGTWPPYEQVTFRNGSISAVGEGDVSVAGEVKGREGLFDGVATGRIQGLGGVSWNPASSGWRTVPAVEGWGAGTIRERRWAGWITVSFSIARGTVSAGDWRNLCFLPTSRRPDVEIYGAAVSNFNGGTAVQLRALPTGYVQVSFPDALADTSAIRGSLSWPR